MVTSLKNETTGVYGTYSANPNPVPWFMMYTNHSVNEEYDTIEYSTT